MTLLALAIALILERLATHLLHLREPRWLDPYLDWGVQLIGRCGRMGAIATTAIVILLPALPIVFVAIYFRDMLAGAIYLVFATFVLLISLGPRDLGEEVEEYVAALEDGDEALAKKIGAEFVERPMPDTAQERSDVVRRAIFVQANNRIFGVITWFVLLGPFGPVGAWVFRVSDLLRRRYIAEGWKSESAAQAHHGHAVMRVHGAISWLPSRLLAVSYALAGSFEDAVADWRQYYENCSEHFFEVNDDVVACAGCGALGPGAIAQGRLGEAQLASRALSLVTRTLLIWFTAIAVLTVIGLA